MAYAYEPGLAQPRKGADEDANILKEFKVGPFPPSPPSPCPLLSAFALAAGLLDTDTNRKHDASPHPLVRCSPVVRLPTPSPALKTRCCRPSDASRQPQTAPLTLPHKLNLSCSHACGSPPPHESDARSPMFVARPTRCTQLAPVAPKQPQLCADCALWRNHGVFQRSPERCAALVYGRAV